MRRNNMGERPQAGRGGPEWGFRGLSMIENPTILNINKELENLRRKRDDIRRQQEMLNMETQFHKKRQYESQQSNNDFSNMYGNVWESSPPKRFHDYPQVKPWMEGAGPGHPRPLMENPIDSNYIPPFNNPLYNQRRLGPLMKPHFKPIVHPILKQGVGQRVPRTTPIMRKDFIPNKITKNKPHTPNNMRSYPVAERKNLITKAVAQESSNRKPANVVDELTLRENQLPSQQMTGRLELALGNLVKEIKNSFTQNVEFSNIIENTSYKRIFKQAIRERIRQAMIGHRVGTITDIVAKYRTMFPKDTDKEIVDLVVNAKDPKKLTVVESDDPENFFKANISGIIEKKMEEMFSNLVKIYSNALLTPCLAYAQATIEETTETDTAKAEDLNQVIKNFSGHKVTLDEKQKLNEFYTELIENILEKKIPEALPKCMKHIIKIFDIDHQYKALKCMTVKRIRDNQKGRKSGVGLSEPEPKEETKEQKTSNKEETTVKEEAKIEGETSNEDKATNEQLTSNEEEASKEEIKEDVDKNTTIEEKMQNETNDKQEATQNASVENGTFNDNNCTKPTTTTPLSKTKDPVTSETPKTPATPSLELPYYVKLFGRPKLPSRAAIHDFLKEYSPVSIKKHKTINNLLVVGFSNEADYNNIITATETLIGNITLIIKASEKATGKENDSINNGNETPNEAKESTPQAPKIDLNEQISNLFSTIRQSDKESASSDNSENKDIEMAQTDRENKSVKLKLEPLAEDDSQEAAIDKGPTGNVKESGRATPVRASSRLANATPSSIRTRRASRLLQE